VFELDTLTEVLRQGFEESSLIKQSTDVTKVTGQSLRDLFTAAGKKRALGERIVINSDEEMQ
jgi:hypothetical protein